MTQTNDLDKYMPDEARVATIKTHIAEYNAERPGILSKVQRVTAISLFAYAIVAGAIMVAMFNTGSDKLFGASLGFGIFGGVFLYDYLRKPIVEHQLALRYRMFPQIFAFIDNVDYEHGREPAFLSDLKALKLVNYTSTENDDRIKGSHDGLQFEMVECKMIRGSGKHKETIFRGLVFHFKLAEPFPGVLVASKRGGWLERTWKEMWRTSPDFETTKTGNLRLDETHTFRTSNHAAAGPVLAGPLTSVLTWLGNEWMGGEVQIALSNNDGYLMLPASEDYFSLPSVYNDVDFNRDVRPIIREMALLLGVAHRMQVLDAAPSAAPRH